MPRVGVPNMNRGAIAKQTVQLIRLLEGRRYMPTHAWLADEMRVTTRTVRRYLDALEQAGWPLPQRGWHKSEAA